MRERHRCIGVCVLIVVFLSLITNLKKQSHSILSHCDMHLLTYSYIYNIKEDV